MSENFFYFDRPAVPATQQVLFDLSAFEAVSVGDSLGNIMEDFACDVAEVKDEDGEVDGTLLYVPGKSYSELFAPTDVEVGIVEADDHLTSEEPTNNAKDNIDESIWEHLSEDERLIIQEARGVLLHEDLPLGDMFALQDLIDLTLRLALRNRNQYAMLSTLEDGKKWAAYADEAQDESDGIV
jgi:hypothetical protein